MTTSFSSRAKSNFQAQVDFWDARIEEYQHKVDVSTDAFTQRALFDELIHLQAKRDQFIDQYRLDDLDDDNFEEEDDDDTEPNEEEPTPEDLEEIEDIESDDEENDDLGDE